MLHLEPGKISGRGAAHGIDSTTQMPRRASPGRRHNARAQHPRCPDPGPAGPIASYMLLTHQDLRTSHDGQPGTGPVAACRSARFGKHSPPRPGVYSGRIVVSEPIGDLPGARVEVPEASYAVVARGGDQLRPFAPKPRPQALFADLQATGSLTTVARGLAR
jgi:hypothetical protein